MKKYFFGLSTFFIIFSQTAFGLDGIIIVLEAPILKSPSMGSTVLQLIRKGQRVYIPREYESLENIPEFFPTFDRAGNEGFVPSRYVKVIVGSTAENLQPILYAGHDPTDYRLEEPIPKTYPFEDKSDLRTSLALMVGNNTTATYQHNNAFYSQKFSADMGGRIAITRKVAFDKYDRFYFGFIGMISTLTNETDFLDDTFSRERRNVFRGGPWLTYDAFKNEKYRLSIATGFTFNYHYSSIKVDGDLKSEVRAFSGLSLSPMTSTTVQINEVLPNTDFLAGVDFSLFLPHSVESKDEVKSPELWSEDNAISSGLKPQASMFLGFQFRY